MINKKIKNIDNYIFVIFPLIFYIFFWIHDGAVWCADTNSYIDMVYSREPLYPTYLALFRLLFGTERDTYLFWAIGGQSLLAAVATWSIARYVSIELKLNRVLSYMLLAMPMCVSLLNRFAAGRKSMYSNSILTEGLTISLYLLFIRFCYEYVVYHTKKSYIWCILLSIIGISLRKQMYILLCMLFLAMLFVTVVTWSKQKQKKLLGALIPFVTVALVLGICVMIDCTYNLVVREKFVRHTEDNRFVTTLALYTAEREYVDYIEPELQDLYLMIYDECEDNGWLMHDAPTGWIASLEHFDNNYDCIQLDTMQRIFLDEVPYGEYVAYHHGLGDAEKMDVIRKSFNRSLIPHEIPRIIKIVWNNFLSGLVTTIAQRRVILCIFSIIVYLVYVVMMVASYTRDMKNGGIRLEHNAAILATIVLISIMGNVGLVSLVIFTQARYTVYNMSLFYIALIGLLGQRCKD